MVAGTFGFCFVLQYDAANGGEIGFSCFCKDLFCRVVDFRFDEVFLFTFQKACSFQHFVLVEHDLEAPKVSVDAPCLRNILFPACWCWILNFS
jgi:hypothetical protein